MSSGQEVGQIFGAGSGPATALLRSPTVIIAAIGLWGMNIYLFKIFGIDYEKALTPSAKDAKHSKLDASSRRNSSASGGDVGGGGGLLEQKLSGEESGGGDKAAGPSPTMTRTSSLTELESGGAGSLGGILGSFQRKTHTGGDNTTLPGSPPQPVCSPTRDSPTVAADDGSHITSSKLIGFSAFLYVLLHVTSHAWITLYQGDTIGAIFAFYTLVGLFVLWPSKRTQWIRRCCRIVGGRFLELIHPRCYCCTSYRPVPFVDVFFADAMCSMSKVFFDWGMLWHLASHYPDPVPPSLHSILIPSACAAWPYLCRARQCLVMHTVGKLKSDPKRYLHVLNAIKYSTSLWPLCLSAYQKTVSPEKAAQLETALIVLLTINSLYAFTWDVTMDWGMMQDPTALLEEAGAGACVPKVPMPLSPEGAGGRTKKGCLKACLRPKLRYGPVISTTILMTNFVLRFCWMLRFYEKDMFPDVDTYILATELFEAFRRAIWNLLRVEWENIKNQPQRATEVEDDLDHPFLKAPGSISMVPLASRGRV